MAVSICGDHSVYITHNTCNECETLAERVAALEARLAGKEDVEISLTDANGDETVATVLARVTGGD